MTREQILNLVRGLKRLPSEFSEQDILDSLANVRGRTDPMVESMVAKALRRATLFRGIWLTMPDGERYLLSIQASRFHYCHPRRDMPSLADYEHVEVALLAQDGFANLSLIGLPDSGAVASVELAGLLDELVRHCERGGSIAEEPQRRHSCVAGPLGS